jgi:antitoxin HicB
MKDKLKKGSTRARFEVGVGSWAVPAARSFPGAVKRMLVYQFERELARQNLTRAMLAERMGTSRAAINRLLDPENPSITLQTIEKITLILGRRLHVYLDE